MAELVVKRNVHAPVQATWEALTDWNLHVKWMLLTSAHGGHAEGATIEAFTGVGRFGIVDTMTIVVWDPPHRCVVRHTGRSIRGSGAFEVRDLGSSRSQIVWFEWLDLPFGRLGRFGWPLVRPVVRAAVAFSLRRLAKHVEAHS